MRRPRNGRQQSQANTSDDDDILLGGPFGAWDPAYLRTLPRFPHRDSFPAAKALVNRFLDGSVPYRDLRIALFWLGFGLPESLAASSAAATEGESLTMSLVPLCKDLYTYTDTAFELGYDPGASVHDRPAIRRDTKDSDTVSSISDTWAVGKCSYSKKANALPAPRTERAPAGSCANAMVSPVGSGPGPSSSSRGSGGCAGTGTVAASASASSSSSANVGGIGGADQALVIRPAGHTGHDPSLAVILPTASSTDASAHTRVTAWRDDEDTDSDADEPLHSGGDRQLSVPVVAARKDDDPDTDTELSVPAIAARKDDDPGTDTEEPVDCGGRRKSAPTITAIDDEEPSLPFRGRRKLAPATPFGDDYNEIVTPDGVGAGKGTTTAKGTGRGSSKVGAATTGGAASSRAWVQDSNTSDGAWLLEDADDEDDVTGFATAQQLATAQAMQYTVKLLHAGGWSTSSSSEGQRTPPTPGGNDGAAEAAGATGLDTEQLEQFTVCFISDLQMHEDLRESCSLCTFCLDDMRIGEELCRLPCMHTFHRRCGHAWLERDRRCMLCRNDVTRPCG